jgi:hypothetical protein
MKISFTTTVHQFLDENGYVPMLVHGRNGSATIFMKDGSAPLPDIGQIVSAQLIWDIPDRFKKKVALKIIEIDGRTKLARRLRNA